MKISEAWLIFASEKRMENYSPLTLKSYESQCKTLISALGDLDMGEVKYQHLIEYLQYKSAHLKPVSLADRIKFARSLFRWALDNEYIKANPSAKLKTPKQGTRIPRALSREDIDSLRNACQIPLEHALLEFIYSSGCRIGEVVLLNRYDINWENRSALVRGKGDKEREVYFTRECKAFLLSYLETRTDAEPYLFVASKRIKTEEGYIHKPHGMNSNQMRIVLKQLALRTNIKESVYPHRLRHSFACNLLDNGAPLEVIQSLLGHAKLDTTRIYAELRGEKRREVYEKFFD